MERWAFRTGCILMGWRPVDAAIELGTSLGTIMKLEEGDLDELLEGKVIERAKNVFRSHKIAIYPGKTKVYEAYNKRSPLKRSVA